MTTTGGGPPARRGPAVGGVLGPWQLVDELGRGGMGAVFLARELASGREVALKVMLDQTGASATDRERFAREAQVAAGLSHPGIVRVHAAGETDGLAWFACEVVSGARDLSSAARELPPEERVRLVLEAARALGHAHARGIVHRDVKPDNLLVDADGRVRVTDFGVAAARSLERLTRTGAAVGTPRYMSPEQIDAQREQQGPPSDVWALGVILHELLTGRPLFEGGSLPVLFKQIVEDATPDLRRAAPEAPPGVSCVVARALEKEPEQRYPDGDALADDLERALRGEPTLAGSMQLLRRLKRAVLALSLLVVVTLGALLAWRLRPLPPPPEAAPSEVAVAAPPDLALTTGPGGWLLLEAGEQPLVITGQLGGLSLAVTVDGEPLDRPTLPLRVPVAAQGWVHVRAVLVDATAEPVVELVAHALRLPSHLTRVDPVTARARDGSLLRLVPPPATGVFDRPALLMGNGAGKEKYGKPIDSNLDAARQVPLAYPYLLGLHELSAAQYLARGAWRDPPPAPDGLPAVDLNRVEATEYAEALELSLPTLTEWTWAACGGEELRTWPWGRERAPERANYAGLADGFAETCPLDALPAGAGRWGHLHLAGNVLEWLQPGDDGVDVPIAARGVAMGGSFKVDLPPLGASTLRHDMHPNTPRKALDDVGCRLAWRPTAR